MNTFVSVEPQKPSAYIAQIVFSMFVYVADVEKDITAQEVRRFQTLLKQSAWSDNPDLADALADLRERYSSFWSAYEDGRFPVTKETIAETFTRASLLLGEERDKKLRKDLNRFLERLEGDIYGVKLLQGDQKAKSAAREELHRIVDYSPVSAPEIPAARPNQQTDAAVQAPSAEPRQEADVPVQAPAEATASQPKAANPPASVRIWQAGKMRVRCVSVVQETHDTKTYNFVAEPRVLFHYKPGQFVTIEIPLATQVLRRNYTISSSPSRPYMLSITVKKVPMGWMSNWLYDNMAEGVECTITGPSGKFSCVDHMTPRMLFLTAGSGVTPCMSMLRWLADTPSTTEIAFINSVRTPSDIIFHQELLYLSTRLGTRLRLLILPAALSPGQPWQGPIGRLSEDLLRSNVPDFMNRQVFTCGPPSYMAFVKAMLQGMEFPMRHYHQESFGGAAHALHATPAPSAKIAAAEHAVPARPTVTAGPASEALKPSTPTVARVSPEASTTSASAPSAAIPAPISRPSITNAQPLLTVKVEGHGESFAAHPGQTILDAAEASGINLPHSCRSGVCGACRMRTVAGGVDMGDGHMLSGDEVAQGHVLTCVGKAKSDLILEPQ